MAGYIRRPEAAQLTRRSLLAAGMFGSVGAAATTSAVTPVAEQAGVPMMATGCADDIVRPVVQRRFIFKLGPNASDVAGLVADGISGVVGKRRVAIMATTDDHGDSGLDAM